MLRSSAPQGTRGVIDESTPARYPDRAYQRKHTARTVTLPTMHAATQPTPAIDDVTRRRALHGLTITYLLQFASMGLQLPFTALAMEHAGAGPAVIGAMWGARSLTGAMVPMLWGLLADRLGSARPLLVMSLVAGGAIFLALGAWPTPTMAIALFAVYGVFAAPASTFVDGMVLTALAPDTHRYGRFRVFGTVGFGIATVVVSVLIDQQILVADPVTLFSLCGLLQLAAGVAVVVLVPPLPRPALTSLAQVGVALRQPILLLLIAAGAVLWASHTGYVSFLSPLAAGAGLPATAVGFAVTCAIVVEMITMPMASTLLQRFSAGRLMLVCGVVAVVRWALLGCSTTTLTFALLHGLHGLSFGLFFVVIVGVIAARVPPALRQVSQGLLSSLSLGVGGVVGGGVVGGLLERGGSPALVWWTMAGIAAVAVLLLIPLASRIR